MKQYRPKWRRHIVLPKLTDREIEEACRLLSAYEVATIPPEDTYTDIRSADYTAYMEELMTKSEAGVLRAPDVPMGWQYYTRKAVAAALIAALLAGIAMPERVIAGYRWLVEVVEQFFEDRKTTYRYTSNADEDAEFVPMQFGYLPEGMEEKIKSDEENYYELLFTKMVKGNQYYLEIAQRMMISDYKYLVGSNIEIYYTDIIVLGENEVRLVEKGNTILFDWITDRYYINGRTNFPKYELIAVLENVTF
ncbi:MAG: DUF4367 domain-containing protein [Peptococcaceae bacterium]|nr:DUF4367 domain-containing protein [Peptococcaceae bacterium]MBP3341234.1 DUF4367 domain-containing protein [Peptococcaceae bacterium]